MEEIAKWIEAHPITVDLFKWGTILLLAWITGFFRFVRNHARKPSISVIPEASRCYIEQMDEFDGCKDVIRAAYLVDVTVRNPTNEKIVVESFSLSYIKNKPLFFRSVEFHPVTMPSRPRQEMGSGTKISKVFFSNFDDGFESLTMSGEIEPKQFQNGYVLFVSFTWGSWNPKIIKGHVRIRVGCQLTTGEEISCSASIQITTNAETFEKWVPGIIDQVRHQCTWNAVKQ